MHKLKLKIVFQFLNKNLSLCGCAYVQDNGDAGDAVAAAAIPPAIGQRPI